MTKAAAIKTNEGQPDQKVSIKAFVVIRPDSTTPVVLRPPQLEYIGSNDTTTVRLDFTITNVSNRTLTPRLVDCPRSLLAVSLPELLPPGRSGKAVVTIKRAGMKETFEKSITLQFDDEKSSRFTVPVAYRLSSMTIPQLKPPQ